MKYKVTFPDLSVLDYSKKNEYNIVKCLRALMPNLDFSKAYEMAGSKGMYVLDFDPRSGNQLTQEFHDAIAELQRNGVELEYHGSGEDEELKPEPKIAVSDTDPSLDELRALTIKVLERKNYAMAEALIEVLKRFS